MLIWPCPAVCWKPYRPEPGVWDLPPHPQIWLDRAKSIPDSKTTTSHTSIASMQQQLTQSRMGSKLPAAGCRGSAPAGLRAAHLRGPASSAAQLAARHSLMDTSYSLILSPRTLLSPEPSSLLHPLRPPNPKPSSPFFRSSSWPATTSTRSSSLKPAMSGWSRASSRPSKTRRRTSRGTMKTARQGEGRGYDDDSSAR